MNFSYPTATRHVYSYKVRESHPLIRAAIAASRTLMKLPTQLAKLVQMSSEETAKLPDGVLVTTAVGTINDTDLDSLMGVINAANATMELAQRYRARTAHPVIASGDMEASMAWAISPEVRDACLAAMHARKNELTEARDEPPITLN